MIFAGLPVGVTTDEGSIDAASRGERLSALAEGRLSLHNREGQTGGKGHGSAQVPLPTAPVHNMIHRAMRLGEHRAGKSLDLMPLPLPDMSPRRMIRKTGRSCCGQGLELTGSRKFSLPPHEGLWRARKGHAQFSAVDLGITEASKPVSTVGILSLPADRQAREGTRLPQTTTFREEFGEARELTLKCVRRLVGIDHNHQRLTVIRDKANRARPMFRVTGESTPHTEEV